MIWVGYIAVLLSFPAYAGAQRPSIDSVWAEIEKGLNRVYARDTVSTADLMNLYNIVYGYCVRESLATTSLSESRERISRLYYRLERSLQDFVDKTYKNGKSLKGEEVLEYYATQWDSFTKIVYAVKQIFMYFDETWVHDQQDDGNDVYKSDQLSKAIWKDRLFAHMQENVAEEILKLIKHERDDENFKCNSKLVKGAIESYVEMGFVETIENYPPGTFDDGSDVYRENFEERFIAETEKYYDEEAKKNSGKYLATEYMKMVERRLQQEQERLAMYLPKSTKYLLEETLSKVLISNHLDYMKGTFMKLLETDQFSDFERLYTLCKRVKNGLDGLPEQFREYVEKYGRQELQKINETSINIRWLSVYYVYTEDAKRSFQDPRQYFETILRVYNRLRFLVNKAFKNEVAYIKELDKGCHAFINKNSITGTKKSELKSAELLARYCDVFLRKFAMEMGQKELEERMVQIMTIIRYLDDRGCFESHYNRLLARRFVNGAAASYEIEGRLIGELTTSFGQEYSKKMQQLLKDNLNNKNTMDDYREHLENTAQNLNTDFSVLVFASCAWPMKSLPAFDVPPQLARCLKSFTEFYATRNRDYILKWMLFESRGEITTNCFQKPYKFIATAAQMAILMLFNENDEMTVQNILDETNIELQTVARVVKGFVKIGLLSASEVINANTTTTAVLKLNTNFRSNRIRVDLIKTIASVEQQSEEAAEVEKTLELQRKYILQAAITRIMKSKKTLSHNELVLEIYNAMKERKLPAPSAANIKQAIEILIEKEYIQRSQKARNQYEYLA